MLFLQYFIPSNMMKNIRDGVDLKSHVREIIDSSEKSPKSYPSSRTGRLEAAEASDTDKKKRKLFG